ncbi:Glycosyltransferase involved in cell wall bisynthesis [Amycolatopsis australiensis]|uniref:Glycosyltransferase involved in cell wall bisynthesis n=2 Tax=Amycolatopsis australiensis TaxID=546364 RepID=A0A1K1PXA6_9PSEU|nr:Glycosyltransferase involved in cell wall bisynthesis [Amycolatopsis australiensis]
MKGSCARATMWTPLPPRTSGIADYSYHLTEALSELLDVAAMTDAPGARVPTGVRLLGAGEPSEGVPIYHVGNHAGVHGGIYRQAIAAPGVVVLHDPSLLDFHAGILGSVASAAFREEVRYAHGPIWGHQHDPALLHGLPAIEVDGVKTLDHATLTLERRLVTGSRGVVVHDPHTAGFLRARYPGIPVHTVPHGALLPDPARREPVRAGLGWTDDLVVFGVFGSLAGHRRVTAAVLAFAELRRRWPNARLVIAGHAGDPVLLDQVRQVVAQSGFAESVHFELSPAEDRLDDLILAADAVLSLRWPTAGETSGTMLRAFGAGRVVITSNLPQHRHYDSSFCWTVPTSPAGEAAELYRLLERGMCWPEELRAAGELARKWTGENATWPIAAQGYADAIEAAENFVAPPETPRHGVNVFADVRATTGLSESARRYVQAMAASGTEMTFTEFNSQAPFRTIEVPPDITALRRGKEFDLDLWIVNVNEWQLIPEHALDRYTIAVWAWELPEPPVHALPHLPGIDELWLISQFVSDSFRTVTDIPITVVPNVVPQAPDVTGNRAKFGLPEDGLIVLFTFSASSSDARKNPWAVIEAFRRAFPPEERGTKAHLVLKANDLQRFPDLDASLSAAVASVDGTLLRREMSRADMDTLLATCDVYTSLHRSEGFGLGMAEAMAMGKPVVATGFGGNIDFMPPGAAAVVGYHARPITPHDHKFGAEFGDWYTVGQLWADADVDQAARWLRKLADSPRLRAEMGAKAIEAIRDFCSPAAVAKVINRRLAELARDGVRPRMRR